MIGKVDWLVNRILFSIYDVIAFICYLFVWLVYWLLLRPICYIPFIKRLNKSFGEEYYNSLSTILQDEWSPYRNSKAFYGLYGGRLGYHISAAIFMIPISFVLYVAIITIGTPFRQFFSKSVVGIILFIIVLVLSSTSLSDYFFWKDNRHHAYVKTFMKESLIKRITWVVGTFAVLIPLCWIDFRLLGYIIDAHP